MGIREYLQEYRALTLDAMEKVDENGSIVFIMDQRQKILNEIVEYNCDTTEIKCLVEEMELFKLDNELKDMIISQKSKIKKEMLLLKRKEQANTQYMNYGRIGYIQSSFDKRF